MDQDKVNPFVGNTETPAGGSPVSAPSVPVNPYAPAGAPYAPGSNTPAPDYYAPTIASSASPDSPAVPNTSAPDPTYTSFSPAPSQSYDAPEKPKLFTKKFIIFAIIGLVLIAGAVVAGVMIQNNKKSDKTTQSKTTTSNSYQKPLNTYMNYIVAGSNSSDHKDFTYDENTTYFLVSKLYNYVSKASSESDAKAVITNAKKYFEAYYEQVPDDKKESDNKTGVSIALYRDVLNLLDYIINNQPDEAGATSTQFVQELKNSDLGPAIIYASLFDVYIESGKSDESAKDLDDFINSYAAYLLYNSPDLDIQAKEGSTNE